MDRPESSGIITPMSLNPPTLVPISLYQNAVLPALPTLTASSILTLGKRVDSDNS